MNPSDRIEKQPSLLSTLAFPLGFLVGIAGLIVFGHLHAPSPAAAPEVRQTSPLVADLAAFVTNTLTEDPVLVFIGLGLFGFFAAVSSVARLRGLPTGRFLALFKSAGFATSLALVAAKLPPILTEGFPAAAAISPVYQTMGWITFAVAAACGLELLRETAWLLTHNGEDQ